MFKYILALIAIFIGMYYYDDTFAVIHKVGHFMPCLKSIFHATDINKYDKETKTIPKSKDKSKLFTSEELKKFVNKETGLYLAILGEVYDVSKGYKHYGPSGGYHFFTGRDGSRAFVTGDFTEDGLIDDVLDLEPQDIKSLFQWLSVYKKDYKYKGKLIGRYFDVNGNPTDYRFKVESKLKEAEFNEQKKNNENIMFPPCNAEWSAESGSRVWCTKMSGGIQRDWIGVPRMLYLPGSDSHRCACVNLEDSSKLQKGNFKEYPDCHPKSTSCNVYK